MKSLMAGVQAKYPTIQKIFLDSGYIGEAFEVWAKTNYGVTIQIQRRHDEGISMVGGIAQINFPNPTQEQVEAAFEMTRTGKKVFKVVAKRWVVERTFAWFYTFRRLKVDYEEDTKISEGFVYVAACSILLKRLCGSRERKS